MENLVEWRDSFSTGFVEIDNQHKELLQMLNILYSSMKQNKSKEQILNTIEDMVKYANFHFDQEEQIMNKNSYSGIVQHLAEHEKFRAKTEEFKVAINSKSFALPFEIVLFLKDWLFQHILITDKKMFKTIKSL